MEVEVENNNIGTTTEAPADTEQTKSLPKEPEEIRPQAKLGSADLARSRVEALRELLYDIKSRCRLLSTIQPSM